MIIHDDLLRRKGIILNPGTVNIPVHHVVRTTVPLPPVLDNHHAVGRVTPLFNYFVILPFYSADNLSE